MNKAEVVWINHHQRRGEEQEAARKSGKKTPCEIERTSRRRVAINGVGFSSWPLEPDPVAALSRMATLYEQGSSQREIAQEFRCSWATVRNMLHATGCKRHAGGKAGR